MMNDYIYLDNAATTNIKKEVLDSMIPHLMDNFGNPSSLFWSRVKKFYRRK